MELHELEQELARFRFHGLMSLMKASFTAEVAQVLNGPDQFKVRLHCEVPDRDTGEPFKLTAVTYIPLDATDFLVKHLVVVWLHLVWEHEFLESVLYDGQRMKEQH